MPNPTAPEMLSDLAKWTEALDTAGKILALKGSLKKQVELVKAVARKADAIASDEDSLKQFQTSMSLVCQSGDALLVQDETLDAVEADMEHSLKSAMSCKSLETVEDCISKLDALLGSAWSFNEKLAQFRRSFDEAVEICTPLMSKFQQEKENAEKSVSENGNQFNRAVGLGVGSAAIAIVSFFTLGILPAAAGLVAGAACAYSAVDSHFKAQELYKAADEFRTLVNSFNAYMTELDKISEKLTMAGEASHDIHRAIAGVIQMYREKQDLLHREQKLEEENCELRRREIEQEEKIRQLEEQLRQRSNDKA